MELTSQVVATALTLTSSRPLQPCRFSKYDAVEQFRFLFAYILPWISGVMEQGYA
jgi:hypothetical protein